MKAHKIELIINASLTDLIIYWHILMYYYATEY